MGDGGVACMHMDRFPIPSEKTIYASKSNGNGFRPKSLVNLGDAEGKKRMKVKAEVLASKKADSEKSEFALDKVGNSSASVGENGENGADDAGKEEVEEGELGTLKWPRSEVESGEFIRDKWRRSEIEKGDRWRKGEIAKGELSSSIGKWRRRDAADKGEFGSWRDESDREDYVPDRWQKVEADKDDYYNNKMLRYETGKEKRWNFEHERTPPSGKYLTDDILGRKKLNRSVNQHAKPRWESGQERSIRISSKIVDDEGSYNIKNDYNKKNEYRNGKYLGREYSTDNRLKRYGTDSDKNERRHHGDYTGLKSRRLSDENSIRSGHSVERSYRNSSSSRLSPPDKYSSRHYTSSLSSKLAYERHGPSTAHSERSPRERARYYDHRDWSPARRDRSSYSRERSPYSRERSPYSREKSPYGRSRQYDHGYNRSPSHTDRSSPDRARYREPKDRASNYLERSPLDRGRSNTYQETSRKSDSSEKHGCQSDDRVLPDEISQRDPNLRDSNSSAKEPQGSVDNNNVSVEIIARCGVHTEEQGKSPSVKCKESSQFDGACEEPSSMEEDMDICDTPPHVPLVTDSSTGKWFYLDYSGVECGPSKLCDLKALVEEGALMSDHFIKHLDSDRWVTVEKAVSPMATLNFPSIVPDSITQLVSPPEAPGNELADTGDVGKSIIQTGKPGKAGTENDEGTAVTLPLPVMGPNDIGAASEPIEDLHIDERVAALLDDLTVIPGRELETIGEALWMTVVQGEALEKSKGCSWQRVDFTKQFEQKIDEEILESVSVAVHVQDSSSLYLESSEWFYGWWSCKGGDWKRNEDAPQDIPLRKKLVLNDGFPLCKMPKSAYEEDPRWHCKDDLYYPSQSRLLDLPSWAFSCPDERSDCDETGRVIPNKLPLVRCVKGAMLPVIRINACVVKDHGSFVSEPRMKVRAKDRYPPARSSGTPSSTSDAKRPLAEAESREKASGNKGLKGYQKFITTIDIPKDRVHTFDYLQLHLGDWYYYDGAGYEHGPSSYSELQLLVDQGVIQNQSNVFRKFDRVWVPVTSATESSEANRKIQPSSSLSEVTENNYLSKFSMLHNLHTQFIGYTREKIHELVMKSYKSREFAAAINQVLDPWISTKQPKKEMEKNTYWKSDDVHATKRARMSVDESEGDHEMGEALHADQKDEPTFDDLCGETTFQRECNAGSESQMGSWGLLDGHVLARVFHCLRSDMKSVVYASSTCKHWRAAARFYRHISRQVDMSFLGSNCTDSLILNIMDYYSKEKVNSMVLAGCTNISPFVLEEIIGIFPSLSSIDITGCSQLGELACKYPNMNWVKSRSSSVTKSFEEAYSKVRSLKQVTEKSLSTSTSKGLGSDKDDFGELKEYFESVAKRDSANQLFRRSLYKRSKLFDARRSSSIVSRDARTRRWAIKKSEDCYKRMQEFLASGLKEIMKENTFEFFGPKVAEIQDRMKNGYYIGHGINSVKEDIRRMCRDAIKAKNKREPGDLNHFVFLFKELASRLEGNFKSSLEQDEMKSWEDDIRFASATGSKYRKKHNKMANERKYKIWFNGTSTASVGLSRQKKKTLDSGSESNDFDGSSEDDKSDSQSTVSDAESDLGSEARTVKSKGDGYFTTGGGFGSDDREWGARMTKASLVPPVTRKYETIEKYVLVADEEDVERKMRVSLPDDYGEKLNTVKNGTEELDMELPEVKDFKPRKLLGHEVLEQEVYGIDPYTHNLLLDSMPEELEWPLQDKHLFIEDVLLRTLNKQVSDFTGMRNTPMTYPLQRVIEEIERSAEEECDIRTMRICQGILKAIDSRPDDKYVGYRKGLGVVCNYVEGFGEDDFVVEFLGEVYPVWKWFEKQDGIRSLQKNSQEPAPEFYNIYLERPKGDAEGYDLVVVDAMHKANYASRICHSCRPNCEAKVTAVDGHYQIGIYTLRKIQYGEEITFDYNSVTESKEEYEASVCLCGSQVCRGSYLNLTGEGAFEKVLEEWHGVLDRYNLMLEACELNSVSEEDYLDLGRAGLGSCLLGSLPDWLVAYSARLVRFINFERTKLPEEILRHNLEEKRKYFSDILLEVEKSDAEVQAEGVYNQRLQNLAVTLDKVRYVMRCIFEDPKKAPPPLKKLSPEDTISFLWQGEGSLVEELLHCLTPHLEEDMIKDLRTKIRAHNPSILDESQSELQQSLLWLRDEVRDLPCTHKSRNDAAADLIHIYAYTKCFFRTQEYKAITSPPVYISPLDLGPKCAAKLGPGLQEYSKTYGESYCLGQLIFWHNQTNAEPDCSLVSAIRGCLSLPDIGSFYAKVPKPSKHWVYGPRTVRFMLSRMEKQPQRPWPKDRIWSFKNSAKVFGSPMMDSILKNSPLEKEMVHWLKHRQTVFEAMWDQ